LSISAQFIVIVSYYGPEITARAFWQKGMYSYVGSDVHHNNHIAALNKR
jgi:hypothetical protein